MMTNKKARFDKERILLIGKTFGFLRILDVFSEEYGNQNQRRGYAKCVCDCGVIVEKIMITHLKSGKIVSCGHYNKEVTSAMMREKQKKFNEYLILDGETMGCYSSNDATIFYFDTEDYEKIRMYCWHNHDGYATATRLFNDNRSNQKITMHRLIMGEPESQIDHEDRNRANNKKYNLKLATPLRNAINRSKQKNNTTGFIGVYEKKDTDMFFSKINQTYLGQFSTLEEALLVRLQAELDIFGKEIAPQRHLFEEYGIE